MANPYLVQAIYGPQPTTPTMDDAKDASSITEAAAVSTSPYTAGALIETLYGEQRPADAPTSDSVHPAREFLMQNEPMETEEEEVETIPWVPTAGPNVVPLGERSGDVVPTATSLYTPMPLCLYEGLSSQAVKPVMRPSILTYPPERYLPPPGLYYDQFSLESIFGHKFFNDKCSNCWRNLQGHPKAAKCQQACAICGMTDHADESCSLLYCTLSWHSDRATRRNFGYINSQHFRPTDTELEVLRGMDLIKNQAARGDPIVPNMLHPLVQSFYGNKPSPQPLNKKLTLCKARSGSNKGRGVVTKPVESQLSTPGEARLSGTIVNSSLDPRLQTRLGNLSICTEEDTKPVFTGIATAYNAQGKAHASSNTLEDKAETKIQELEDEVMNLKMDNIAKDREIRRLRAELAELQGEGYERGKKRPRN